LESDFQPNFHPPSDKKFQIALRRGSSRTLSSLAIRGSAGRCVEANSFDSSIDAFIDAAQLCIFTQQTLGTRFPRKRNLGGCVHRNDFLRTELGLPDDLVMPNVAEAPKSQWLWKILKRAAELNAEGVVGLHWSALAQSNL
jgi:hypothetical protein